MSYGQVREVIGSVVDIEFPAGSVPQIYNALRLTNASISEKEWNLTVEVSQHLGENTVRCIALDTTEGLVRGQKVMDTKAHVSIPVGPETLGRIMNVVGEPVDEPGPIKTKLKYPIHRAAPKFTEQSVSVEQLVTGI